MSRFLSVLMKLVDLSNLEQKKEEKRAKTLGLVRILLTLRLLFILTYNFSELHHHILFYIFLFNSS